MLSRDGVIARYIFAFCFFFLPGSEMVNGWPATVCGLLGSMELASGLMGYSPLAEWLQAGQEKSPAKPAGADPLKKPDKSSE